MEVTNLNHIMKSGALTAEDIGQAFGYTAWQVYNIKQGKTRMPADMIVKLSDLVRVSPAEFKSKDLGKLIKSMVIVINKLPDDDREKVIDELRKQLDDAKNTIISLQAKLLEESVDKTRSASAR